jgi:excisionase family DNA binding protein
MEIRGKIMGEFIDESYRLLDAGDVAEILNVSKVMVYKLMQLGRLKCVSINSSKRVRPEDLEDYIERNLTELDLSRIR